MARLFLALVLPRPLLLACLEAADDAPAGWAAQDADQLHLTLRFVGALEGRAIDDLGDALGHLALAPLSVGLDGVGHFDQGRQGALVARAGPRDALLALHRRVDRMVVSTTGLAPEGRAYFPHVTLARARRGAEAPARWIERHAGLRVAPVPVRHLGLFESHLGRDGARYELLGSSSFPLPS